MEEDIFNIFALPKDVVGVIFNMLNTIDEISLHRCVSKRWTELYWSCLSGISVASPKMKALRDDQMIYILDRINPSILTAFESFKSGSVLTMNSMSLFTRCTNLRTLKLQGLDSTVISEALTSLISLKDLHIGSKKLTDECLIAIAEHLTKLTRILVAASSMVTRWPNLTNIKPLKELTVALMRNFTVEGFADIARLDQLTFLNVNANLIKDRALERILMMTNLRSLSFTDAVNTNPKTYAGLVNMTQLRVLNASMRMEDESLSALDSLHSLVSLGIATNTIGSAKILSNLTSLQTINLFSQTNLTNTAYLSNLTNLHTFDSFNQQISEEFPLDRMPNLKNINVSKIEPKAFAKLTALKNLQVLSIHKECDSVFDWSAVASCNNLKRLLFRNLLTVEDLKSLAQCTQLDDLTIKTTNDSTSIIRQLTELVNLRIDTDGKNWTIDDIAPLTALKNLKLLQFKGDFDHKVQSFLNEQFKSSFGHPVSVIINK